METENHVGKLLICVKGTYVGIITGTEHRKHFKDRKSSSVGLGFRCPYPSYGGLMVLFCERDFDFEINDFFVFASPKNS